MTEALHTLYRPTEFEHVVGHPAIVKTLKDLVKNNGSQAFLFCGPAGTGKTTLARITAAKLGCRPQDILEIDGATYTGVDDMRKIQEILQYKPFGGAKRAIIIDEVHRISQQAFDSLLKVTEQPPPHIYWLFATTNPSKVPKTIQTRFATFTLKAVSNDDLHKLIIEITGLEKITLAEGIADLIVKEAQGSPRQALVNLALCRNLKDRKEAAQVLQSALQSEVVIELCRFLLAGGSWQKAMIIANKLENEAPESVRIVVCQYMAKVLLNSKTDKDAKRLLQILDAFAVSYQSSEGFAPLLLSVGRVLLFNEGQ